jgi:hypothetical protein
MSSNANGASHRTGWCRSTRSNPSQNCVEVRVDGEVAMIRDSKHSAGPMLACGTAGLSALVDAVRRDELTGW